MFDLCRGDFISEPSEELGYAYVLKMAARAISSVVMISWPK
jgi:hypothetical protein